jgi:hypothetical protein
VLATILAEDSSAIVGDPLRFKELLLERWPHEKQADVLALALAHGVVGALRRQGEGKLSEDILEPLVSRLVHRAGVRRPVAVWAVTIWARALDRLAKHATRTQRSDAFKKRPRDRAKETDDPFGELLFGTAMGGFMGGAFAWANLAPTASIVVGTAIGAGLGGLLGWAGAPLVRAYIHARHVAQDQSVPPELFSAAGSKTRRAWRAYLNASILYICILYGIAAALAVAGGELLIHGAAGIPRGAALGAAVGILGGLLQGLRRYGSDLRQSSVTKWILPRYLAGKPVTAAIAGGLFGTALGSVLGWQRVEPHAVWWWAGGCAILNAALWAVMAAKATAVGKQ